MNNLYKEANEIKDHLLKHKGSIADIKCLREELDETKKIFREVLGDELIKKVVFIPK